MSGLDLVAIQDLVAAHIVSSFASYEVKEDEVLDDESILKIDNRTKPFIVLRWHGLQRSLINTSFGGARHDEYSSGVDIVFVAPTPRIAKRGINMIMEELIGWRVPNGSQLVPSGGRAIFPVSDYEGKPHLYLGINTLEFQVNTSDVGS